MKKETVIEAFVEGMTMESGSWVAINAQNAEATKVIFYTPSQDIEEPLSFREFSEIVIENELAHNDSQVSHTEVKATATGSTVREEEDYDEETRKSWKVWVADVQILDVYKQIDISKIPELVKAAEKDLDNAKTEAISQAEDNADYQRDPYAYHGVSRSDFI